MVGYTEPMRYVRSFVFAVSHRISVVSAHQYGADDAVIVLTVTTKAIQMRYTGKRF